MKNSNLANNAHTPVTLINLFANAFQLNPAYNLLWLKGIYLDRKQQSYRSFYYDRLKDEQSGQIVTIKLPEKIKQSLTPNNVYIFKGALQKDVRLFGVVEPVFVVADLITHIDSDILRDTGERIKDILYYKKLQGIKPIDKLLLKQLRKKKSPQLTLIYGATSIVMDDVNTALGSASNYYTIIEKRINLLNPEQIIKTLTMLNINAVDFVAIARGGGPGLEIFDNLAIAQTALDLKIPLITAIGHAQNVTLLEKIADKHFTTPTAFGTYLLRMAEAAHNKTITTNTPPQISSPIAHPNRELLIMRVVVIVLVTVIVILLISQAGN